MIDALTSFFYALGSFSFLRMALFASLSASVAGGVIGSYVVVKRIVFISGSIAHSVLGGMGLFLYLSRVHNLPFLHPIYGAFLAAILSAFLIGWIHLYYKEREDTVIGAIWACGMAMGVIFTTLSPGYNVEIIQFLFGNILWTSKANLVSLLILDGVVLVASICLHKRFLAICFDETQAKLQGMKSNLIYFTLLSLVAITVVLLIQIVGAILVIAILSLPPAIANCYTQKLSKMIGIAILLGMAITFIGMYFSYTFNWPPGATIALTTTFLYFINLAFGKKSKLR